MHKPVFVLGVGAQKSGTTWLSQFLRNHPGAEMGFSKEYHVFDALFVQEPGIRKKFLQRRINTALGIPAPATQNDLLTLAFLGNLERYFDYFESLVSGGGPIALTGDITPSYCALPAEAFSLIKAGFERRGIDVKVLFLMRDPVERCISAVRHVLRQKGESFTGESYFARDENAVLKELYACAAFEMRTRYDKTILTLERVFDPADIQCIFYEELFREETTRRLCAFLRIAYSEPDYRQRVNASNSQAVIEAGLRQEIYRHYRPVYDFISQRFGRETVSDFWVRHD